MSVCNNILSTCHKAYTKKYMTLARSGFVFAGVGNSNENKKNEKKKNPSNRNIRRRNNDFLRVFNGTEYNSISGYQTLSGSRDG